MTAVNSGRVEVVKYLAENEKELKPEMFKDGWTPLMAACAGNADDLIKKEKAMLEAEAAAKLMPG